MNPYRILGVSHRATDEEVRRAYKTLAKKYHPDLNPDDPAAAMRMGEINRAYSEVRLMRRGQTAGGESSEAAGADDPFRRFYSAWQAYEASSGGEKRTRRMNMSRWKSANATLVVMVLLVMFLLIRILLSMLFGAAPPDHSEWPDSLYPTYEYRYPNY